MPMQNFRVVYAGPSVDDGEMDVEQLASSLLALGKLIESADAVRTGEANRVNVRVKSDLQRGSFDVGIVVHLFDAAIDWAQTPGGAGTLALLGLVGFNLKDAAVSGARGVIQLVRHFRGRRVASQTLEAGNTTLVLEDGERVQADPMVARMAQDGAVRQNLERFTEPLREDGVEAIRLEEQQGVTTEVLSAGEAAFFQAAGEGDPSSTATFSATYQIKRLFFERGRKWRLSNGAQTIQAEIVDEGFWRRIDASQEVFAKEDYLVCVVRMDQWLTANGLRTEYVVESVTEHLSPPKQEKMF